MRILVTGASGQLGGYVLRELSGRDVPVAAWSGSRTGQLFGIPLRPVDLADETAVAAAFHEARPTTVIHAAARSSVAECYREPERARRVNTQGSALLAALADAAGARLLLVSTDLVFDGEKGGYCETDAVSPLSIYGRSKVGAEAAVRAYLHHAVIRVSLLYGPSLVGVPTFFDETVRALRQGQALRLFADEWRTPLSLPTAASALVELAVAGFEGLLHLGGPERLSRLEAGQRLAHVLGCDSAVIVPALRAEGVAAEPRPRDTSLDSTRWRKLYPGHDWPTWEEALRRFTLA
jgi:dTDP-4-dehydrorhamnose reductase